MPIGEHRWQRWQAGGWEERTMLVEPVAPDSADNGNPSSDPASDRLIPDTASAGGRLSRSQQTSRTPTASKGSGRSKKANGRFEQWLADSQAASLPPPGQRGENGAHEEGSGEGLVPRAGHLGMEAESSESEDGETVLVDHTPEALRRKKRKNKGGGCCGSRPQQEKERRRKVVTEPEQEPEQEPEPSGEREREAVRQSFGRLGD